MKVFKCAHCGQSIYFENTLCEKCGKSLGFDPVNLVLVTLEPTIENLFTLSGKKSSRRYRYCSNHQYNVCNWLIPEKHNSQYCVACDLNRTIPDLNNGEYMLQWNKIEVAKHRLIYSLLRMKLPVISKAENEETGLAFDFIANTSQEEADQVMTGHHNGLITINIAEADDVEREAARKMMHEVYRTLLGHFRHEIAHYYWDRLIPNTTNEETFRQVFGDERIDYAEALKIHYEQGAPADWNQHFISAYASMHPWEDWAETWAHYMHIVDTLETAYSFGIKIETATSSKIKAEIKKDPYQVNDFDSLLNSWLPLTFAMNSLNRSMGLNDLYPFLITPAVKEKMRFIHELILSRQFSIAASNN